MWLRNDNLSRTTNSNQSLHGASVGNVKFAKLTSFCFVPLGWGGLEYPSQYAVVRYVVFQHHAPTLKVAEEQIVSLVTVYLYSNYHSYVHPD
jgi:hypothetical protein